MKTPARPRVNQAQQWLAYPSVPGGSRRPCPTVTLELMRKKQVCLPSKEYLSDRKCEMTNMAAKCKIFVTVT